MAHYPNWRWSLLVASGSFPPGADIRRLDQAERTLSDRNGRFSAVQCEYESTGAFSTSLQKRMSCSAANSCRSLRTGATHAGLPDHYLGEAVRISRAVSAARRRGLLVLGWRFAHEPVIAAS